MADRERFVVAQMAWIWLAEPGTAAPVDPVTPMPTGWWNVGYFTPDSLGFSTDPSFEEIRSHQSNFPTRRFQTEDNATFECDLQEWSGPNFRTVFGGGTIVEVPANPSGTPPVIKHYKFTPPAVGGRETVAACIELIDGAKHYRRMVPLCEQSEGVEQTFEKTSESTLPLRMTILGSDIGAPFYDLTDDEAFDPAA